ncbi:MAG: sulfur carrier protein ThiS [Akkermansiaceae bacterium]
MEIQLNGIPHQLETETSVLLLLKSLKLDGKPVVVELNQGAILSRNFHDTTVTHGDQVEIVTLAAGG